MNHFNYNILRQQFLAGLLTEDEFENKAQLLSKSNDRKPFDRELMKKAIEQGLEVGVLFQSDNEKYKMPVSKYRIIRPVAMGTSSKGNLVIRALHVIGQSEKSARKTGVRSQEANNEWRLLKAKNIRGMWLTGRVFTEAPAGYHQSDRGIKNVEVTYDPSKAKSAQDDSNKEGDINNNNNSNL